MISEDRILEGILQKRNDAVEKLYDNYSQKLLVICYRYCGNREDAEDVLHEGFLKILGNISSFKYKGTGSMVSWMKKIMVNTALNSLRKKNRFSVTITDIPDGSDNDDEDFINSILGKIDNQEILKMIGSLPDGYRTVFNMYVFDNYSHKEIAATLNFSENTSKSQLSKSRAMLRRHIDEFIKMKEHSYEKENQPA